MRVLSIDIAWMCLVPSVALFLRLKNLENFSDYLPALAAYTLAALAWKLLIFMSMGLYRSSQFQKRGDEIGAAVLATGLSLLAGLVVFFGVLQPLGITPPGFPRSIPVLDGLITMVVLCARRRPLRDSTPSSPSFPQPPASERLLFVDAARGWAILLALYSHAMIDFEGYKVMTEGLFVGSRVITRAATPLFLIMFGMMLELVYLRKLERGQGIEVRRRLLNRSLLCYGGFVLTIAAGLFGGHERLTAALKVALMLHDARFANILRFYTFALLLAWPLLHYRHKFGSPGLVVLLLLIWGSYPLWQVLRLDPSHRLYGLAGVLIGPLGAPGGPSVFYGMTFVIMGMACIIKPKRDDRPLLARFDRNTAVIILLCVGLLVTLGWRMGVYEVVKGYALGGFRARNHAGYFAAGGLVAMIMLWMLSRLVTARSAGHPAIRLLRFVGRNSLTAYTTGNVVLNLFGRWIGYQSLGPALVAVTVFLILVVAIVAVIDGLREEWRLAASPLPGAEV